MILSPIWERKKFYHKFIIKNGLNNTDMFIVHGHFLKNQMERFYNINSSNISVIPHGNFGLYKKVNNDSLKRAKKGFYFLVGYGNTRDYNT